MLKKTIFSVFITLLLILSSGCSKDKQKSKEANELKPTNEYVLTSTTNKKFTVIKEKDGFKLKGAKDKVVIFDIFATWCPPCRKAARHLSSLQKKYKDNLIVIGITIEDNIDNEKLKEFKKTYGANYVLVNSKINHVLADKIVDSLKLGDRYPIPLMVLYKDGKYITHYVGSIEEEFVESDIKRALKL